MGRCCRLLEEYQCALVGETTGVLNGKCVEEEKEEEEEGGFCKGTEEVW